MSPRCRQEICKLLVGVVTDIVSQVGRPGTIFKATSDVSRFGPQHLSEMAHNACCWGIVMEVRDLIVPSLDGVAPAGMASSHVLTHRDVEPDVVCAERVIIVRNRATIGPVLGDLGELVVPVHFHHV